MEGIMIQIKRTGKGWNSQDEYEPIGEDSISFFKTIQKAQDYLNDVYPPHVYMRQDIRISLKDSKNHIIHCGYVYHAENDPSYKAAEDWACFYKYDECDLTTTQIE